MKQVTEIQPVPCKICQSPSHLFGVVDFNKSCLAFHGEHLPLTGFAVYYHRCAQCGFIFTTAFDAWTPEAFQQFIYNDQYVVVDPEFVEIRPMGNVASISNLFQAYCPSMRLLDYGGGSGLFAQQMREKGFAATTYDPFSDFKQLPTGTFNCITCFEVMEHVPFPDQTVATMAALLEEGGLILFTTLLQPTTIEQMRLHWWYASPRNGHVSLYSVAALVELFRKHGLRVGSCNDGTHVAYRELPDFAAKLQFTAHS